MLFLLKVKYIVKKIPFLLLSHLRSWQFTTLKRCLW